MTRLREERERIEAADGSLHAHASMHQSHGVLFDETGLRWIAREWAPRARGMFLTGDFNDWNRSSHPLEPCGNGDWLLSLPADTLAHGQRIKLHVVGEDGSARDRIPACIRRAVQDPLTNDFSGQVWHPPQEYRWLHQAPAPSRSPLIYEAHAGIAGEEGRVHDYRHFTDHILPRIARAGYDTLQLMAVQEHPYYGSFGYHVSSFFAPSSRFGTPEELKELVDAAHGLGIAVLLDIVHSHAVRNLAEGINDFDGSGHQYFHAGGRGDHPSWDSKCFDYGRPEVRRFLLSNVRYWLEEFRFDGFRFDGVTSMLYHSRGNRSFGCYDDYFGDDTDQDAVLYLQLAAQVAEETRPGALLVAEDMSGMPGLCRPAHEGGVGFTHRLAMGVPDHWIKLLKHQRDEDWSLDGLWSVLTNRRHGESTIAYAESHDQALVGDKTLAFWLMDAAMYGHMAAGDTHPVVERGIALHKLIRLITMALAGEGWLNFIGNEFGHPEWLDFPREGNGWSFHYCRRQWSLADDPNLKYRWLADFDRELMTLARETGFLASGPASCRWIDHQRRIIAAERGGLCFAFNFAVDLASPDFAIPVSGRSPLRVALDTDATRFGGHGRIDAEVIHPVDADGIMRAYLPPRTGLVFAPVVQTS